MTKEAHEQEHNETTFIQYEKNHQLELKHEEFLMDVTEIVTELTGKGLHLDLWWEHSVMAERETHQGRQGPDEVIQKTILGYA